MIRDLKDESRASPAPTTLPAPVVATPRRRVATLRAQLEPDQGRSVPAGRQAAERGPPAGRVARRGPRRGAGDDDCAGDDEKLPPLLVHTGVDPDAAAREPVDPDDWARDCEERRSAPTRVGRGADPDRWPPPPPGPRDPPPVDPREVVPPERAPPERSAGTGLASATTTRGALGPAISVITRSPTRTSLCVGLMAARRISSATSRRWSCVAMVTTTPAAPARAVRPDRCR